MSSFEEAREVLFLLDNKTLRNPEFNYKTYHRFNLHEIKEPDCKTEFHFNKNHISALAKVLVGETFRCSK